MAALRVAEANLLAFRRSWRAVLVPAVAQPVIMMIVFAGLLGTRAERFVRDTEGGPAYSYQMYVAIGIVFSSVMLVTATEVTTSTFFGFQLTERFTTIVTTPVSPTSLVLGSLCWVFAQGTVLGGVLFLLATPFLGWEVVVRLPLMMVLVGLGCAAVAAPLGALISRVHNTTQILNITSRVVLAPMVLFSATFFPATLMPAGARFVVELLPLAHANMALREVYAGSYSLALADAEIVALWLVVGATAMVGGFRTELSR